jgi:hypothetical protein
MDRQRQQQQQQQSALIAMAMQGFGRIDGAPAAAMMAATLQRSARHMSHREQIARIAPIKRLTGALSGADYRQVAKVAGAMTADAVLESGAIEWLLGAGRLTAATNTPQLNVGYVKAVGAVFDALEGDPDNVPASRWTGAAVVQLVLAVLSGADEAWRANLTAMLGRDLFKADSAPNPEAAAGIMLGAGRRWITPADAAELLPKFVRTLSVNLIAAYISSYGAPADAGQLAAARQALKDATAEAATKLIEAGDMDRVSALTKKAKAIAKLISGVNPDKIGPVGDDSDDSDDDVDSDWVRAWAGAWAGGAWAGGAGFGGSAIGANGDGCGANGDSDGGDSDEMETN